MGFQTLHIDEVVMLICKKSSVLEHVNADGIARCR